MYLILSIKFYHNRKRMLDSSVKIRPVVSFYINLDVKVQVLTV